MLIGVYILILNYNCYTISYAQFALANTISINNDYQNKWSYHQADRSAEQWEDYWQTISPSKGRQSFQYRSLLIYSVYLSVISKKEI